ncbi:MAG: 1-acyl-sn-glycerol-3-phosphate acyltransferase, partial [Clostridiales Family XIII bacterium]|nr:1-acyl-sn-glycerol-3-phosphate acyltransferase [Clostridiales Family XIII bacterium]
MNTEQLTEDQKLHRRKIHPPNFLIYNILVRLVVKRFIMKNLEVCFNSSIDIKDYKGPFIIVSNHASRLDYVYSSIPFLPRPLNFVSGYNEFFRSHLAFIFRLMQVIPKKNFISDTYTIRAMKNVFEKKGVVVLFPEGMSSISGGNQPSAIASGKVLKHFGVPVVRVRIKGAYFVSTKFDLAERPGRVDVDIDPLFTPEQLARLDADEIQRRLDEAIRQDDYEWNRQIHASYRAENGMAAGLHTLLYRCPKCGCEFEMKGEGDEIFCRRCGNGAKLTDTYKLIPRDTASVAPRTPRVWYDEQRREVREWVAAGGWELRERVSLGLLPEYGFLKDQKTSEIAGEGELVLNDEGLHYTGTRNGEPWSF